MLLPSDHGDEFQGKTEAPVFAKAGEERWAHPAQLALLRLLPAGFDSRGPHDRQQGLRPIQIWVPDMRSPAFVTEAHRQSVAVANSPHAKEDQDFIDAVSDWGGM